MKIDTDLRAAIRSAEKAQPEYSYEERAKAEKEAIAHLLRRKPASAALVRKASRQIKSADALNKKAYNVMRDFGLNREGTRIQDEEAFISRGGKLPGPQHIKWKFDRVMAELAAADPAKAKAILKKYGINWA